MSETEDAPLRIWHDDEMLTLDAAAARLGYSSNHFKSLKIPCIGKHRARRYRWGDIKEWIAGTHPMQVAAERRRQSDLRVEELEREERDRIAARKAHWRKSPPLPIEEALKLLRTGGPARSKALVEERRGNWVKAIPEDFAKNTFGGLVYFIDCKDMTKIGFTTKPVHERVETWLCGNPFEMTIFALMPGEMSDERELHIKFKRAHAKGEWFKFSIEERREVAELVSARSGVVVIGASA